MSKISKHIKNLFTTEERRAIVALEGIQTELARIAQGINIIVSNEYNYDPDVLYPERLASRARHTPNDSETEVESINETREAVLDLLRARGIEIPDEDLVSIQNSEFADDLPFDPLPETLGYIPDVEEPFDPDEPYDLDDVDDVDDR